jgi:hypothetical protein
MWSAMFCIAGTTRMAKFSVVVAERTPKEFDSGDRDF